MSSGPSFQARYQKLLAVFNQGTPEQHAEQVGNLARALMQAKFTPKDLLQLHRDSLAQLKSDAYQTSSALLLMLLIAYSQFLFEKQDQALAPPDHAAFDQVAQHGPLAILISRMRDDLILDANDSFFQLVGFSREEVLGKTTLSLGILVDPDDKERATRSLISGERARDFETKLQTKTGDIREVLTTVELIEIDGEPCYMRMAYDITERKQKEEQLLGDAIHNAFHDGLTGLPNRALLLDRLDRTMERARHHEGYTFAVLFLDIDHFKDVNDQFGHAVGDQLLAEIADRLSTCMSPRDTVARLGGDEFAILLDDTGDVAKILRCAENIQEQLQTPFHLGDNELTTSASIGIALSTGGRRQAEDLLADADKAMYRAKAHGRARHEVFNRDIHARAVARLQMRTDLEQAIEDRGFQVYYQPIIDLGAGKITGFEALGRWLHPSRGLVSPAEFIPLAEETGLIIDIGRWLMLEACRQVRYWQDAYPFDLPSGISINLTSREFSQPDLIPTIQKVLSESGLPPSHLSLEITEGVILEDPEQRALTLESLRDLGVKVYIDDFGTGHASFNFMYSFPIDALKIDNSFIHRIGPAGENAEIVRTIIMLAQDYGMQVIGEGIETADQLAVLRDLRCRYGQGFYFARPMNAEKMDALLASQPHW